MIAKLVIFLIRVKLKLKKYEKFRFDEQKSRHDYYFFTDSKIMKRSNYVTSPSSVSLNWLLDPNCKVVKVK